MLKKTVLIMTSALVISSSSMVQAGVLDTAKNIGGKVVGKSKGAANFLQDKGQKAYSTAGVIGNKIEHGSQQLKDTSTKVSNKADDLNKRTTGIVNNISETGLNASHTLKSTAETAKTNAKTIGSTAKTMGGDVKEIWDPRN